MSGEQISHLPTPLPRIGRASFDLYIYKRRAVFGLPQYISTLKQETAIWIIKVAPILACMCGVPLCNVALGLQVGTIMCVHEA